MNEEIMLFWTQFHGYHLLCSFPERTVTEVEELFSAGRRKNEH